MNRYFGLHTLEGEWHALLPRYLFIASRVENARILDIGCGSGLGSSLLLELGARAVDAIDHRPAVLELARMKHAKQGLDFHVMLWEELDFAENSFDIILCLDPSSPVTDPNLLREVRRVLKPNGEYICAIERRTIQGIESLLPRYGYAQAAEQVDINEPNSRVPQVGELSRHFGRVLPFTQRPQLSFVFDYAQTSDTPADVPVEGRREGEDDAVVVQAPENQGGERWLHVEKSLCSNESEIAGVELWLCGNDQPPAPRLLEVRLPYYSLTERMKILFQDIQSNPPNKQAIFDELLEEGTLPEEDISTTTELAPTRREEVTQVRSRYDVFEAPPAQPPELARPALQLDQLDAHLTELDGLHKRIKSDFARLLFETTEQFQQRADHLEHVITSLNTSASDKDARISELVERVAELEAQLAQQRSPGDTIHGFTEREDETMITRQFIRADIDKALDSHDSDAVEEDGVAPALEGAPADTEPSAALEGELELVIEEDALSLDPPSIDGDSEDEVDPPTSEFLPDPSDEEA